MALPAHHTQHLQCIAYPFNVSSSCFHLTQRNDRATTGTALWLGAQCLALYLASIARTNHPLRAIDLGSGIGLLPLALGSLGYDVLATDVPLIVDTVLRPNILANPTRGTVDVRVLDWTEPLDTHTAWDLIVTADTLYEPSLVRPLLRTLHALARASTVAGRAPPVYVCLERRDPALIEAALAAARDEWGFALTRVADRKIARAMGRGGVHWAREEWAGVEVWKLALRVVGDGGIV
ncbi:putative methyltransferase-domain-containing protein [Hygrophoropsis aurantiaca]|uniref:Methyltransferase-domain-containing protein n=1 Tax=Hygrophoropsis aurantiaca TaxID=72124 RepID=A0ACB8ARK4_9AGAM|nr:putative methyltransferase-domain-containing protein [Hygrophoropsis aurantiaca]